MCNSSCRENSLHEPLCPHRLLFIWLYPYMNLCLRKAKRSSHGSHTSDYHMPNMRGTTYKPVKVISQLVNVFIVDFMFFWISSKIGDSNQMEKEILLCKGRNPCRMYIGWNTFRFKTCRAFYPWFISYEFEVRNHHPLTNLRQYKLHMTPSFTLDTITTLTVYPMSTYLCSP